MIKNSRLKKVWTFETKNKAEIGKLESRDRYEFPKKPINERLLTIRLPCALKNRHLATIFHTTYLCIGILDSHFD